jgi:ATP-binding cassette subfamily B protein
MLRRIIGLFASYRRQIALLGVAVSVTSVLGTAAPFLTKWVFDHALFPKSGKPDIELLGILVGAMVVLTLLGGAFAIVNTYLSSVIGQGVMQDLRDRLYAHLQTMSLRFFTTTRTGEIQSRIANDIGGVQSVVTQAFSTILSDVILVTITLVAMVLLSWQLTLISVAVVVPFVYFSHRIGRIRRDIQHDAQRVMADMSVKTEETLSVSGVLLSKVFHRQRDAVESYRADSHRLAELRVRQQMVGRTFLGLAQSFFVITPAVAYLAAGFSMSSGTGRGITAGTLVAFTALQSKLFNPFREMLQLSLDIQSSMANFERIFQFLDLRQELADAPDARELRAGSVRGHVAFRGVHFRYEEASLSGAADRNGDWTLRDVELEIQPGQLAALVGPSGAGKTTLTYLLARLYDVAEGAVLLDGTDVRDIRLSSLADTVGMVTQDPHLFHTTVRQNLLYARPGATESEVEAAARAAHIHERIMELPDGYDTLVGERGYRMSGGEKQRLSIARTILKDPRILILDEATSSLDTTSERLVQSALRPLMRGRTTIAIAHRLSTIIAADVIFVLDRGRVVERGTHAELVEAGGLYASLHQQQFQGGMVEARCDDGLVLASGDVLSGSGAAA